VENITEMCPPLYEQFDRVELAVEIVCISTRPLRSTRWMEQPWLSVTVLTVS